MYHNNAWSRSRAHEIAHACSSFAAEKSSLIAAKYNSKENSQLSIVFTTPWKVGGSIDFNLGTAVVLVV